MKLSFNRPVNFNTDFLGLLKIKEITGETRRLQEVSENKDADTEWIMKQLTKSFRVNYKPRSDAPT